MARAKKPTDTYAGRSFELPSPPTFHDRITRRKAQRAADRNSAPPDDA